MMDRQTVFTRQMLGRKRRPESLGASAAVLLPDQGQHSLPQPRWRRAIRRATGASVLQPFRACPTVTAVQPLRLAIAHLHQCRRRSQLQRARRDPCQHARASQLSVLIAVRPNPRPPEVASIGDISNESARDNINEAQTPPMFKTSVRCRCSIAMRRRSRSWRR